MAQGPIEVKYKNIMGDTYKMEHWKKTAIPIPAAVPESASSVHVYVTVASGYQPPSVDWQTDVLVYTQQPEDKKQVKFTKKVLLHAYSGATVWSYNSENISLPITSDRAIYIELQDLPNDLVKEEGINITAQVEGYTMP